MTLVVTLRGGKNACLETPMLIFMNAKGNYPIRGVKPINGIVYRSGPKGWMDRRIFCEWLKNDQCVRRDPHGRTKPYSWTMWPATEPWRTWRTHKSATVWKPL
jgi:hypothetical protein